MIEEPRAPSPRRHFEENTAVTLPCKNLQSQRA